MTISIKEFRQLQKFMALTFSDTDAEALTALRMANKVLKTNNLTWDMVFARVIKIEGPQIEDAANYESKPKTHEDAPSGIEAEINEALTDCLDDAKAGTWRDFLLSLEAQWSEKHYLSVAQKTALFAGHQRLKQRGRR